MKMILRPALKGDLPSLKKILEPWSDHDPGVVHALQSLLENGDYHSHRCELLEIDKVIRCAALWTLEKPDQVRIVALVLSSAANDLGAHTRFLTEEILQWADLGISKVNITVPEALAALLVDSLKSCGFMFEGICSACAPSDRPLVRLCKHFLYRSIPHGEVMGFLREFLLSLGYEIRNEGDGFGFRVRSEYRLPFIFSPWHRVTRSGPDIIVHPPARVLELHELETLFYPLKIRSASEKPLLLPMEKKAARHLIELPDEDACQNSLFRGTPYQERAIRLNRLTFCHPSGLKGIRRGLPLMFYVNRLGAVGVGRVEDWYLDEPKNLYNKLDDMTYFDPEDVKEQAAASGPRVGKVLLIRFQWYRPFKRVVSLEKIRSMDGSFNPQRARSLARSLYRSIVTAGTPRDR